jgi:hypothetical protein
VLPYWLLFAFFAAGAILGSRAWYARAAGAAHEQPTSPNVAYLFGGLAISLLIGLRYEVGGDWFAYMRMYSSAENVDLFSTLLQGDPGYQFINWIVIRAGLGVWAVNLVCGAIFAWGLFKFATRQANPWLTITVAIPYLVIVVAMGYTRQAVAIGLILAGLSDIGRGSLLRFAIYCVLAVLFHKSAIVVLPVVALSAKQNRFVTILLILSLAVFLYYSLVAPSLDRLVTNYIDAGYQSSGAGIRVAMNLPPAFVFLLLNRRFGLPEMQRRLWRNFSIAAVVCLAMLLLSSSSTAVDRIALYVIPLQLFVFSALPAIVSGSRTRTVLILLVVSYSFAVEFVWLNYADNAGEWLPYQLYPIGSDDIARVPA